MRTFHIYDRWNGFYIGTTQYRLDEVQSIEESGFILKVAQ